MSALNKVMLIGRLGKDPESKQVGSSRVTNFSIAITEKFKNKDGAQQEKTEWVNIVTWNRQAEIAAQYLQKGSLVFLEGKIQTRSWDNSDGKKCYVTEIIANNIKMLGGGDKSEANRYGGSENPTNQPDVNQGSPEDDLPF